MSACTFPHCANPAGAKNKAGQDVCLPHVSVVIGSSGVPDRHDGIGDES